MKKLLVALICIAICAIAGYFYINQPHKNYSKSEADISIEASRFISEFNDNPKTAEDKYRGKILEIKGEITSNQINHFMLNDYIYCVKDSTQKISIEPNENVVVKGRYIGFDDLLEEIKLDHCIIIK